MLDFSQTCSFSLYKTLTDWLESWELLVDYCFYLLFKLDYKSALILTAPIHLSIGEQVM